MKYFYVLGFLIFSFLTLQNFKSKHIEYKLAKTEGEKAIVEVTEIPDLCQRRNNRLSVKRDKKEYSVLISNKKCVEGVFKVGDKIEMIYVPRFDKLFIQKPTSKFNYILSIAFFLIPIGFLAALLIKRRK
jgi:hypothetical protein